MVEIKGFLKIQKECHPKASLRYKLLVILLFETKNMQSEINFNHGHFFESELLNETLAISEYKKVTKGINF